MASPTTCPKCGAPVAQPAGRFCMACGAALAPAQPSPAQAAPPPAPRQRRNLLWLLPLILFIAAIIGVMAWRFAGIGRDVEKAIASATPLPIPTSTRAPLAVSTSAAATPREHTSGDLEPVAVVNGQSITIRDYQKRVKFAWFLSGQVTDPQGTSLQTLDQMVDEQLLREQAKQRGITVGPGEVTKYIEKLFGYLRYPPTPLPSPRGPTPTPLPTSPPVSLEAYQSTYKSYLERLNKATGLEEADFRALAELDLLRQKLYDAVTSDVPTIEEQVRAQHILVRIVEPQPTATRLPEGQPAPTPDPIAQPTPVPRSADQAVARIGEVKQKLDAGGDFAVLAKEYSEDLGSKDRGGELGWFGRGQMVKEFEDAAFALQPGQVSEPVRTQFGYHLIKVEEHDPARELDAFGIEQKKYEAFIEWLDNLRGSAKVDRFWSLDRLPPTPQS